MKGAALREEKFVDIGKWFSYAIDQMAAGGDLFSAISGDALSPDQVGLLGRTPTGMQLGHWFPVWLPDSSRADPDPSGFGDIGAFPAANVCATIDVPSQYTVVTSGVRLDSDDDTLVEGAAGLRDFSMLLGTGLDVVSETVEGVEVRVWAPANDTDSLNEVLGFAVTSQQALSDAFGPYPWTEIDLVSAPLGAGVGGMEWPGMVWIEGSLFSGGLPGLGGLSDLFGDTTDFEALLGDLGGSALATTLEWTIAHELGHEWWHALVGNDSIESPAVDEPLAQFSACIAMQQIHPDDWRNICEAQTLEQYAQSRALGVADSVAEQPSDQFDSALQYGAVIYGKAPGFYFDTADLIGWEALIDALESFVAENAFDLVSTDTLRQHLIDSAGSNGDAVDALWTRWFRESNGDLDIEPADLFQSFGFDPELFNLGDVLGDDGELDLEDLAENLGNSDLEDLLGDLGGLGGPEDDRGERDEPPTDDEGDN